MLFLKRSYFFKHISSLLFNKFYYFLWNFFAFFRLFLHLVNEDILYDRFEIPKTINFLFDIDKIIISKKSFDILELSGKNFCNIATYLPKMSFINIYSLFINLAIQLIKIFLQLKSFFKNIQKIIHFIPIIENYFWNFVYLAIILL